MSRAAGSVAPVKSNVRVLTPTAPAAWYKLPSVLAVLYFRFVLCRRFSFHRPQSRVAPPPRAASVPIHPRIQVSLYLQHRTPDLCALRRVAPLARGRRARHRLTRYPPARYGTRGSCICNAEVHVLTVYPRIVDSTFCLGLRHAPRVASSPIFVHVKASRATSRSASGSHAGRS